MTLNPARLARFADWASTLPPRPLPLTAIPVPGEYYLDYISRLADANHLELLELTDALDDPAAVILDPGRRKQHRQERLAAAASQPLARIARLYWDDHGDYLRDPGSFRRMLRPACRRCATRRGIAGPIACRLPPHQTVCRRHRLWTGPAARTHAASSTSARSPRSSARSAATSPSCTATRGKKSTPPPAPPPRPSTRPSATASGSRASGGACDSSPPTPGNRPWPVCSPEAPTGNTDNAGHPAIEIAIYPDVVWLAARSLREHSAPP